MSRRTRIVVPGLPHHVTQRGNYKQNVFEEDSDFRRYAYLFAEDSLRYKVKTLAYCLMKNHVHFILVPQDSNGMARLFSKVHMQYSQYMNRKKDKKGHLWQGRFYSCVMSWDHLYRAVRYVERNPVRAGMVVNPWEYPWSSAKQHIGKDIDPIIRAEAPEAVIEGGGLMRGDSWIAYLAEEDERCQDLIRKTTGKGLAFGSEDFIRGLETSSGLTIKRLK
ncbi:MAG TPA: transposase [Candidatus Omnitrophota bacterium]|nr:transposase [Candidatus Omnitrophota bacterium]